MVSALLGQAEPMPAHGIRAVVGIQVARGDDLELCYHLFLVLQLCLDARMALLGSHLLASCGLQGRCLALHTGVSIAKLAQRTDQPHPEDLPLQQDTSSKLHQT